MQLVLCAFFQCTTDCAIMSQFWFYRKRNAEIALKQNAKDKADGIEKTGKPYNATELFEQTSSQSVETGASSCDTEPGSMMRRPLSPHLVTLQEDANSAFARLGHNLATTESTPGVGFDENSPMSAREGDPRRIGDGSISSAVETSVLYDNSANTSVLGFVQTEDNDIEKVSNGDKGSVSGFSIGSARQTA